MKLTKMVMLYAKESEHTLQIFKARRDNFDFICAFAW